LLPDSWEKWWKSEDTRMIHFIGKDNIVFHCIVFPSMLKAYGDGFILPENVPANEFLNLEGDKISTSRNWAVWLHEYLQDFPGKQDTLRYVLTANAPETKDNDFTWKDFQTRHNSELLAIFGNFVNRAVVLTHKYFGGCVPAPGELQDIDKEALAQIPVLKQSIEDNLETFKFREALREAMNLARVGNKYISDTEPWAVAKTDMERTATILYTSIQLCASLSVAFAPFLPFSVEKLNRILNVQPLGWDDFGRSDLLPVGHKLNQAELLFSKIEDAEIEKQVKRLADIKAAREAAEKAAAAATAPKVEPAKETCTFDEFVKMDIRTATVLAAERVPKTDKLLKLTIDTGLDQRTIVSGIAQYYTPEEMVGKQICILANLQPRVIRGIESKGMILMAKQLDGTMRIVTPEQRLANGSTVG
jgi:methionyl-tRNA synthetase